MSSTLDELPDRDLRLETREVRAQTQMRASAEGQVRRGLSRQIRTVQVMGPE